MIFSRLAFRFAKKKPLDAFKTFLQHDIGASVRQEPHQKDRKYAHVEIAREFKRQEQSRKKLRLQQMSTRKKLLQQKINTKSNLLISQENQELNQLKKEITTLQQMLENQSKELAEIETKLEASEAQMVLIEGPQKLVVLNKIQYLKHMNMHPSGLVLHPQTIKIIENVHYLVNNNLPVNKYKLFELMPDVFKTEIGEMEDSMRRLIEEKKLDPLSDPSGRIRFFTLHNSRFRHPEQDIIDLQDQRDKVFENMEDEVVKMMQPHMQYVKKVDLGETEFRNSYHMITVMLSKSLKLKLTQQEQALKKILRDIVDLKEKFEIYNEEVNKEVIKMRYKYIEPPEWIKNHKVLLERYEKIMVKYTNPEEVTQTMEISSLDDGGRSYLEEKIGKIVEEKYHPIIEELWNSGNREELISKKKELEIDFYNDSTKVLQEYNQMLLQKKEQEEFLKLPKKTREIAQINHGMVSLDDLSKAIWINNSNPVKYNLTFFTNFFGFEKEEETRKIFNGISYLRVPPLQEQKSLETIKFEILKFREL